MCATIVLVYMRNHFLTRINNSIDKTLLLKKSLANVREYRVTQL